MHVPVPLSRRRGTPRRRSMAHAVVLALLLGVVAALTPTPALAQPSEEGYRSLDDTSGWRQAGPGGFDVAPDGTRTSFGGLGMTWFEAQEFGSYSFKVDWRYEGTSNSGIFIGFPPSDDPFSAVRSGYEIQIDPEDPTGNTTGAVYEVQPPDVAARDAALRTGPDDWNTYEILVEGQRVRILLNDVLVNDYTNTDPARGLGRGHIGLQNHGDGDAVSFRNIRIKELAPPGDDFPSTGGGGLPPGQEPGVTLRTFDLQTPQSAICVLRPGQTPNVDKLLPTIDWSSTADFGLDDYFAAQALANLTVPGAGEYTFRLISDDGSRLSIDDQVVIDHDGLHSAVEKDGTVTLSAGSHPLRIDYFENTVDQRLTLEWRTPGSSSFAVVPTSALSTEAGVVRVVAPGRKSCSTSGDSPGDGQQLNSLFPGYDLVDFRGDFTPQVTGLDLLPDGRLVVLTWGGFDASGGNLDTYRGEVYVTNIPPHQNPGGVTFTKVAEGLNQPMGVKVVDGKFYVSEKQRLVELSDTTGDGVVDVYRTVATVPFGGNFHEFFFGLVYDAAEDSFYGNLSGAINLGGITTNPQPAANKGTTVRVDRGTGELTYVAGGLRTPHGIVQCPTGPLAGEIFVTDNQGDWLPSNKIVNVEQGRFFNHYTNSDADPAFDGPFDGVPVTPPAVWIPQNKAGNSPSGMVCAQNGPYAGQLISGDVTYGGLHHTFLERVGGELQGAIFQHSQGFESGLTEVLEDPEGRLYIGGLFVGGNWGQEGKSDGLQLLVPNGRVPFDTLAMRAVPGGFEIEYTQPVSPEMASGLAGRYAVEDWRYQPTAEYGGPEIDERTLPVTSATLSDDRRKVTIRVDGLQAGRVVAVRSPRPFVSSSGEDLWVTTGYYTLNALP